MASGIGSRLLLTYESNVEGNALQQLNALNSAHQQVNRTYAQGAQAQTSLGRMSASASLIQSKAMSSAAQSTFRYTFYAMMALRAGQALATKVFAKGLIAAGEDYEAVWTRVAATLQLTSNELLDMQRVGFDVSKTMPFYVKDVGNAILEMARAGMKLNDIKASIRDVGKLAMIAQVGLADAGTFVVQMLQAYNIKAEKAYQVTDLLAYYQDKATYSAQQMMEILGGVGGTAAAYGQNIAQVMQLATAFGAMGTSAGEADTLIRQLYMNAAKPQVYEAMKFGLEQLGLPAMYNEYGQLGNLGDAFLGFSKFLDQTLQATSIGDERAEMAAKINELVYQLFGVRSSRAFFQIAKMDPQDFKSLYTDYESMVQKATEYTDQYIATLQTGYQYTKQMAQVTMNALATKLGTPMLAMMRPINEARTQLALFGSEMLTVGDETSRIIPMILFLTSATVGLAGAAAVAAGTYLLLKVRMADVGQTLANEGMVPLLRAKGYFKGVTTPSTAQVGIAYFRSIAAAPIRFFASAAWVGGAAYLAYKKNFLGARTFGDRIAAWWNSNMRGSETIGSRLAKKIKEYSTLTKDASGKTTGSGFAHFVKGFKEIFAENGLLANALRMLKPVALGFKYAVQYLVIEPIKFIGRTLGAVFGWFIKWAVGWGDKEKGMERLGNAVGVLVALLVADRTVSAVMNLSKAIWKLIAYMTIGPKMAGGQRGFGLASWMYRGMLPTGGLRTAASGVAGGIKRGVGFFTGPSKTATAAATAGLTQVSMAARMEHMVIGVGGRKMTRQFYAPLIDKGKIVGYSPVGKSPLVDIAYGGRVSASLLGRPANLGVIASNLEHTAAYKAAAQATQKQLVRTMWAERLMRPVNWTKRTATDSWQSGYLYRTVRHPVETAQSWRGGSLLGRGAITKAQYTAGYGGAVGAVGAVSTRSMIATILPYILGAAAIAGIIAMIVMAARGGGSGGTIYQANVTIQGNVGANTEQITAAVQQGLASAKRQSEISQAENAARKGYLQTEMVGA